MVTLSRKNAMDRAMVTTGDNAMTGKIRYVGPVCTAWNSNICPPATVNPKWRRTSPPGPDKCSASGAMEGERFATTHCAVSLYGDARSVAIWFNEDAIVPAEAEAFQTSSYADGAKGGKERRVPLPADLFKALDTIKGETYL